MHEATWLKLMRTSFLLLCLLPTAAIVGWAVWEQSSFRTLAWEQTLRPSLGLIARIDRVSHPKPGQTRFEGVQLIDPETRQRVASTSYIEVTETPRGWRLQASHLDVTTERAMSLWRIWHDGVLREDLLNGRDAELNVERISFTGDTQPDSEASNPSPTVSLTPGEKNTPENTTSSLTMIEWHNVRWSSELTEAQRRSRLEFDWTDRRDSITQLDADRKKPALGGTAKQHDTLSSHHPTHAPEKQASKKQPTPISIAMRRVHEQGDQQTHILIDTASSRLPLAWLAEWLGNPVPASADLRGTLQLALRGSSWTAQLKGQLENIDLESWSRDRIPYQVAGSGHLELMKCQFSDGGIQEAWGKLKIHDGVFDRRLLEALLRNKLANPGPAFAQTNEAPRLEGIQANLTFHLNQFGFNTAGENDSTDFVRNAQGVLLLHRPGGKHLDALVRALAYPAAEASIEESQKFWKVAYRLKQWLPSLPPELERKTATR